MYFLITNAIDDIDFWMYLLLYIYTAVFATYPWPKPFELFSSLLRFDA